ncbi:MAG: alpha/beta fold hydrolase [Flavobacteriales bacterium]
MKQPFISLASRLMPSVVVKYAYYQLTHPQVRKLREHELEILDTALKGWYNYSTTRIRTYIWKGGSKSIMLVHGWEGQAGNFSDLIVALQRENYTIYAFDAPSHGFSDGGSTSLFEFTEVVAELIKHWKVKYVVSHSFGGVAVTYALKSNPELALTKYALLTTPDKFLERIDQVASQIGITEKVKLKLIERMESETGFLASTLDVSKFVQEIKVCEALIIHDRNDRVIPLTQSQNVNKNWENSLLEVLEGTGHFRILRTPKVIDRVIQFLH